MDIETKKLIVTSAIQLFLGAGAWFFGWRIARAQIHNQRSDLRIKLFDQRYAVYLAFKDFVEHCALHDRYSEPALKKFEQETEKFEFLFGPEIRKYHREVIANALAIRGILEDLPCEDGPVVGGIVGYFQGSTVLTDVPSLQGWFVQQHLHDLRQYFLPYLDYGSAGVNLDSITMSPPDLPYPPLVKRPIRNAKKG
ncbi:MAG: hypothetical protein HYV95_12890 [Opitutae bacterium]|nr:hypothetical protein [Opitutae bacterium]